MALDYDSVGNLGSEEYEGSVLQESYKIACLAHGTGSRCREGRNRLYCILKELLVR